MLGSSALQAGGIFRERRANYHADEHELDGGKTSDCAGADGRVSELRWMLVGGGGTRAYTHGELQVDRVVLTAVLDVMIKLSRVTGEWHSFRICIETNSCLIRHSVLFAGCVAYWNSSWELFVEISEGETGITVTLGV